MANCLFCSLDTSRKRIENAHAIAFTDAYPVTKGHTLVIPRKHVASIYDLSPDEHAAVWALVAEVRQRLLAELKPDGFNIGVNDGAAATGTNSRTSECFVGDGLRFPGMNEAIPCTAVSSTQIFGPGGSDCPVCAINVSRRG